MVELGELEKRKDVFARKRAKVYAVSVDDLEAAADVQKRFPSVEVLSDTGFDLIDAFGVRHAGAGIHGEDVAYPTTVLVDSKGIVRWIHRPESLMARLPADELVREVERRL